jgi:hypothetical protein
MAHLAQNLIGAESSHGGPYRTWLTTNLSPWNDIDITVNTNIGYLLSLHGIALPKLEAYIADVIRHDRLTSPYYITALPTIYSLARWYHGPGHERLQELTTAQLHRATDPLSLSLAIASAVRLNLPNRLIQPSMDRLEQQQDNDGHWPTHPLFVGAPINGRRQLVGTKALTTTLALEAMTLFSQSQVRPKAIVTKNPDLKRARVQTKDLDRRYQSQLDHLIRHDRDRQITSIATLTAQAFDLTVDAETLAHLNSASLHGWIAYTIYDDFLDGEGRPELLGVANLALRQTVANFDLALPQNTAFGHLVHTTLDIVDGANTWEMVHARNLGQPPDYADLAQLAERSWGHMLAACGVLTAAGYDLDGPEIQSLQTFFRHFLIARQLNDDAHDWEDDLHAGHVSAVVAILPLQLAPGALRLHFWNETIVEVSNLIFDHIGKARQALADCPGLKDPTTFELWLTRLEVAAQQALDGREQSRRFIETFNQSA